MYPVYTFVYKKKKTYFLQRRLGNISRIMWDAGCAFPPIPGIFQLGSTGLPPKIQDSQKILDSSTVVGSRIFQKSWFFSQSCRPKGKKWGSGEAILKLSPAGIAVLLIYKCISLCSPVYEISTWSQVSGAQSAPCQHSWSSGWLLVEPHLNLPAQLILGLTSWRYIFVYRPWWSIRGYTKNWWQSTYLLSASSCPKTHREKLPLIQYLPSIQMSSIDYFSPGLN